MLGKLSSVDDSYDGH